MSIWKGFLRWISALEWWCTVGDTPTGNNQHRQIHPENFVRPPHPSLAVIVPPPPPILFSSPSLIPCHSPHPSVSVALFHLSLFQNVESLLRGETATAEQFLCLRPIARPLIELQLLIKMSESSALWGPEALFNPLRLLLTLALPLHPLSPCLSPLIAIDFLHPHFIFLWLRQGHGPSCLLEATCCSSLCVCTGGGVHALMHVRALRGPCQERTVSSLLH